MHGLMQDHPLLVSALIRHADRHHGDTEIVSRTIEGPIHRETARELHARARRLANALTRLGIAPGETNQTWRLCVVSDNIYEMPSPLQAVNNGCMASDLPRVAARVKAGAPR